MGIAQPGFAQKSFTEVRPAILSGRSQRRRLILPVAPQAGSLLRSDKLQGILAKANNAAICEQIPVLLIKQTPEARA